MSISQQETIFPPTPATSPPRSTGPLYPKTALEAISQGETTLQGPPKHVSFQESRTHRLLHLAAAFRHWSREGYVFGFSGHISYRDPEFPDLFWTNPIGRHFGLLKASDMVLVDMRGNVIGGNKSRPANTAGFMIHSAIHDARRDVDAACHAHSPYGKAWSAMGKRLDMITQDACKFWGDAHSVYESYGGVVLAEEEGRNIAKALGKKGKGCILKNHGLLTVGRTVDEAAWLFDAMEHACRDQLAVEAASTPRDGGEGVRKCLIEEAEAKSVFDMEADPDYCYAEFQVYYEYERELSKDDFTL